MLGAAAPWKLPAVQVQTGSVKLVQRSEVRIVALTHYRRAFVPEPEMQSVKELLAELASTSKVRPRHLTGGSWNWQQIQPSSKKEHCQLVGWLKLPKEEAKKLLAVSGQRGIFVYPTQRNGEHSKIWWVKKLPAAEDDVYLKRVLALATERSQNHVSRKCTSYPFTHHHPTSTTTSGGVNGVKNPSGPDCSFSHGWPIPVSPQEITPTLVVGYLPIGVGWVGTQNLPPFYQGVFIRNGNRNHPCVSRHVSTE